MKITIVYDNEVYQEGLLSDWGFSCFIAMEDGLKLLFDTGTEGSILLHNMAQLELDPASIDLIFISHLHFDHVGGLPEILELNKKAKVLLPGTHSRGIAAREVIAVKESIQIHEGMFSTGELRNIEQSLIITTDKGTIVIAGCSHPGLGHILNKASEFGKVFGVIGGLHGFREFQLLANLSFICPCHCTQYKERIKNLFPDKCIECGAGRVITL